ncbi:MAG: hypothetical protein ACRC6U_04075, partial [Fusobacteriaceae bacterium]
GKQRLTTIFDFIENNFCLEDESYFMDLHLEDMRFLLNLNFHYNRIEPLLRSEKITDVQKVELFLEINELGTKMSEAHLENIKNKYVKE